MRDHTQHEPCSLDCGPVAIGLPGGKVHVTTRNQAFEEQDPLRFLPVKDHDPELSPLQKTIIKQAQPVLPERRYAVVVYELPEGQRSLAQERVERYMHMLRAKSPWDALLAAAEPVQRELDGE